MQWQEEIPRWRQIHTVIKERIESGVYEPGSKLPGILKLQEEFGVATATAQKVLAELKREGLAYTEPGIGTFVRRTTETA